MFDLVRRVDSFSTSEPDSDGTISSESEVITQGRTMVISMVPWPWALAIGQRGDNLANNTFNLE